MICKNFQQDCRPSLITYLRITTVLVSSLYQSPLKFGDIIILIYASIFAVVATSDQSGVLALTMLSIVLSPLGLPLSTILGLLITVYPLINPFRILTIVGTSITITSFISEQNPAKMSYLTARVAYHFLEN